MSFPRAKRFDDKHPDFCASPADYYITSKFGNGPTIPKCSKFSKGNDQISLTSTRYDKCTCSRCPTTSTRYCDINSFSSRSSLRGVPKACSTPQKSNTDSKKNFFNRNDIKNCSFRGKPPKKFLTMKNRNVEAPFWTTEEFIDDDYHSYTSSEELDSLKKLPQQIDNKICKKSNFEMILLKQMEQINKNIRKFQFDLRELKDDIKANKKFEESQLRTSDAIKYIVRKAVDKLRNEFESTQNFILSHTLKRLSLVAKEIRNASKLSKYKIDSLCGQVASELLERICELPEKDETLEFDVSNCSEEQLEKFDNILNPNVFSYENVCKILSDHLQVSQRELDVINEEKSSIIRKFGTAKKTIDAQSAIIKKLHKDLAELKNTYKK